MFAFRLVIAAFITFVGLAFAYALLYVIVEGVHVPFLRLAVLSGIVICVLLVLGSFHFVRGSEVARWFLVAVMLLFSTSFLIVGIVNAFTLNLGRVDKRDSQISC